MDGDVPVSLTCSFLLGERAGPGTDREERVRAIDQSRVGREGACVRGGWVGGWVVSGVAAAAVGTLFLTLFFLGTHRV